MAALSRGAATKTMPVGIQLLIAFVVGTGVGFLLGWLKGRSHTVTPDSRLENELRQQVGQRETELTQIRVQLAETGNARAAAEARHASAEKMLIEQRALQDKTLIDLREAFKALSADAFADGTGISAIGGTEFRKTSGNGQRRSG